MYGQEQQESHFTFRAKHIPDFVTMDISMPEMDGINCTEKMIEAHPDCNILGHPSSWISSVSHKK